MHYEYKIVCDNINDFTRLVTKELLEMSQEHKKIKRIAAEQEKQE